MTNRPAPNPPETPILCEEYDRLICNALSKRGDIQAFSFASGKVEHHLATCPVCQARIQAESDKEMEQS